MISKMSEADIAFKSKKQMNEFAGGMSTIVPGCSHAAAMLRDAAP
ncbi:MAG: hypothetical protein ACI4E5_03065 [Suilimivivens sp.]